MLTRLPYRLQIPLGLCLAVILTALLVSAIAARSATLNAREHIMTTVENAANLIEAQALPLIAADDVWQVFQLMRATAALLPGSAEALSRSAVLDADGVIIAASDPVALPTADPLPDTSSASQEHGHGNPPDSPVADFDEQGGLTILNPLHSEDGQIMGFAYIEVDNGAFAPDWTSIALPAAIGVGLAVSLLVPMGWWIGRRMTRPVETIASLIDRIGSDASDVKADELPLTSDPEIGRINAAVQRLIRELHLRRKVEQRAYSAERLAAIGRMTAAVAHEINNPLGGMLNVIRTLESHGDRERTRRSSLALIERGLNQIRSTVSALLPQARSESRTLTATDFDDIVLLARTGATVQPVEIRTEVELRAPLAVPAGPMRQVMLNLLINACKAADNGGLVQATLTSDTEEVRFQVANNGDGLSTELLDRILSAEAGTEPRGFGLWVCREIATRYDGGFRVSNTDSSMTSLLFWIPNTDRDETTATR